MVLLFRVTRVRWHAGTGFALGVFFGCSSTVEPIVAANDQGSGTTDSSFPSTSFSSGSSEHDASSSSAGATLGSADSTWQPEESDSTDGPLPPCPIDTALAWTSSGALTEPKVVGDRTIGGIKDPSVVYFEDRWHVFATALPAGDGLLGIVYLSFEDWADANDVEPVFLDQIEGLEDYHAAPQVFYFAPGETWYLIYQSQTPQYSTTRTLEDPLSWTAPTDFFPVMPASVQGGVDYWVICDAVECFLFFTDHAGALYRSQTRASDFPAGMSEPTVALQEAAAFDLFEGAAVYKIDGEDQYLAIIAALGGVNQQYYEAYVAASLGGEWSPLQATWENPFAGSTNVTFDGEAWTSDVGQGELLRRGYDQSMVVDSCSMQFLHQGRRTSDGAYALGLLTQIAPGT